MLESISSASDAAWQSDDPRLCCPLVSHVPDETVAVNAAYLEAGHIRGQYDWPTADDAVVPPTQSAQLVCPVEPLVDFPAAHGVQTASLVCPDPALENLPAPQLMQEVLPAFTYLPAEQPAQQLVCPTSCFEKSDVDLPAGHDLQTSSLVCPGPASENLPAAHGLHMGGPQ